MHVKYYVFVIYQPYRKSGLPAVEHETVEHHFTFQVPEMRVEEVADIVSQDINRMSIKLNEGGNGLYYLPISHSVSVIEKP